MKGLRNLLWLPFLLSVLWVSAASAVFDKGFWNDVNKAELTDALNRQKSINTNVAKNLVMVIGDGMGVTTTTATRVLRGQRTEGMLGEEALLSWDKFPWTGLSKTYCTDYMTTDSAASATAYHCGVKTKYEAVGVDDNVISNDCSSVEKAKVKSVLDLALEAGKSVGIITTDAVVGASPSAAYAHAAHRRWRADYEMPLNSGGVCKDIARQLVEDNYNIHVVLGGGRKYFLPNTTVDPEYPDKYGARRDSMNLIQMWQDKQVSKGRKYKYVSTKEEFESTNPYNTDYLFGLFEPDRLEEDSIRRINNSEPSLSEMVEKALKILQKNPKGFYLFIEGANIDAGHHENRAKYALEEGLALDDAVNLVVKETTADDTLVVVTADHSHAFSFGGYSVRGKSILSIVDNPTDWDIDENGNRFTVLAYGNGPGYKLAMTENLTHELFETDQYYKSAIPLSYETHGGEDVPIFAAGPMSHLFTGTHEITFIAHAMAYAACLGEDKSHCDGQPASVGTYLVASGSIIIMLQCGVLYYLKLQLL